jgi:O-antigen ligase
MSSSPISVRPADGASAPASRLIAAVEALFGAGVVRVFAALSTFVHWVNASNGWIFFLLVTKPLVDLTWRWEFFHVINQRVNPQAIIAIAVAVMNGIVLVSSRRYPRHSRRVLLLLGLATLAVIVTPTSWGANELLRLFSGVSFFFSAGVVLGEKNKFDRFAVIFLAVLCIPLILSLFQVAGILPFEYWDWIDGQETGRASGTYQHPLEIVFFLIYAVPMALHRWENSEKGKAERFFLAVFFLLASLGLVFTFHRAGWVAIVVELGVWYGSKRQLKKILLGALAVTALAVAFSDRVSLLYEPATEMVSGEADFASGNFMRGRGANWIAFLVSYANGGPVRWFIGKGGSVAEVSLVGIVEYSENEPHNDFIRILHAYGLIGLVLYLSLLLKFLQAGLRSRNSASPFHRGLGRILLCSLAGILLLSMTAEPMRYPTSIWYLFALGSALFVAEANTQRGLMADYAPAGPGGSGKNV